MSRLYCNYLGSRPPWTNFHENWHSCRGWWCNHSVRFWGSSRRQQWHPFVV